MATETVIYVSLALVLLTRIYVFISPPEFLEEHKDRRYHEYHLYRQYHLHKQSDKNDTPTQDASTLQEPPAPRRLSTLDEDMLQHVDRSPRLAMEGLHHPSDELVLVGVGSGTRSFSMGDLPSQGYSKLDPISPTTPTASPTTYASEPLPMSFNKQRSFSRESEQDLWKQIIGSGDSGSVVPSYISLDMSEINYNGSLERFARDPEVFEAIQELRSEPQGLGKEKWPMMTVVWEGGRWCCLEGRTLYILRALDWQGQVRVRVLVDRNPTLLAVTEECWKAAGMTSDPSMIMSSGPTNTTTTTTTTPTNIGSSNPAHASILPESTLQSARSDTRIKMSAATVSEGANTVGLSLDSDQDAATAVANFVDPGEEPFESKISAFKTRLSCLTSEGPSLPGSPGGHDADDEADETGYETDGEEDDEDDYDDEDDMIGARTKPTIDMSSLQASLRRRVNGNSRAVFETDLAEDSNHSDWTVVSPAVPSPVSHLHGKQDNERTLSRSFAQQMNLSYSTGSNGGDDKYHKHHSGHKLAGLGIMRMSRADLPIEDSPFHQKQHERKISIPEFLLPPPLHDEQVYLVVDSKSAPSVRDNPPRRDSGHGNSP